MVWPIDEAAIHLSLEDVALYAVHEVLMEVDNNGKLTVINPQGILYQICNL
jgi:hypothetical protein